METNILVRPGEWLRAFLNDRDAAFTLFVEDNPLSTPHAILGIKKIEAGASPRRRSTFFSFPLSLPFQLGVAVGVSGFARNSSSEAGYSLFA